MKTRPFLALALTTGLLTAAAPLMSVQPASAKGITCPDT